MFLFHRSHIFRFLPLFIERYWICIWQLLQIEKPITNEKQKPIEKAETMKMQLSAAGRPSIDDENEKSFNRLIF